MRTVIFIVQVLSCFGLIATVLLQSGKSAGLSGSIAGGAETLFGGKKKGMDDLLAKLSTAAAIGFMVGTFLLSVVK